ncbi:MAG: HAMP domain-containing protein, partial [Candidatus Binatia bacterium]
MFFIKSLRTKTSIWALIPTAIVIVVAGIIVLYAYEQVARNVVQERDTEFARISAARLSEGLNRFSQLLKTTATEDDIQSMEPARLNSALEKAEEQLYVFDAGVVVYDSRGVALWSQPFAAERQGTNYPVLSEFDKVRSTRQPCFSQVFEDEISGEHVILIGVPVVGNGDEFKGVLAGISTLRYSLLGITYAEVLEFTAGHSGFGYIVDGNGQAIHHRNNSLLGMNLADTEPVMRATTSGEPGAVLTEDSAGETIISGFAPVPGTGWRLITEERWENVVGPIRGYSELLLGLLVAGGVISGAVIFFNIGQILKPIKDLNRGAQRIAGGDFDHAISARTGDEIQALAEQFNTMAGALKESYTSLEQKVEERTKGERRRAEQLRAINEVGRRV